MRTPSQQSRGENNNEGSPPQGEPVYLAVGRLRRSHGIQGEMIMDVLTGFPERLRSGKKIYVGENHEPHILTSVRQHQISTRIVGLRGVHSPDDTMQFRNQLVYIHAKGLPPLPEGEFYHHELIGLTVVAEDGQTLGILDEILETGANDVYVVHTPEGGELLIPAINEVVMAIDLDRKEMRVHLQDYL